MVDESKLSLYTIYEKPLDYPDNFVVRRFEYDQPTTDVFVFNTLEDARSPLRRHGLHCLPRDPNDDPMIVETWL